MEELRPPATTEAAPKRCHLSGRVLPHDERGFRKGPAEISRRTGCRREGDRAGGQGFLLHRADPGLRQESLHEVPEGGGDLVAGGREEDKAAREGFHLPAQEPLQPAVVVGATDLAPASR